MRNMDYIKNSPWTEEQIKSSLQENLNPHRYQHVLGVVKASEMLALCHGADPEKARIAALYHDVLKSQTPQWLTDYLKAHGEVLGELALAPSVLHAPAGALYAEHTGGIKDPEILFAIRYHTTGRPQMGTLEKIIYLADLIEENRSYDGVEVLRSLAREDLDRAMLAALEQSIRYLLQRKEHILLISVEARNAFLNQLKERMTGEKSHDEKLTEN